jgi:demethylmacrocin O-methyltransferase
MWKSFFPRGRIHGVDIQDKSLFEEERIRIFRGSQVDEAFLAGVIAEIGTPDVIIDDGSHINSHMIRTFEVLFPRLRADGGIYVVEDVQTAYWPRYGGRPPGVPATPDRRTFIDFAKERVDGLNHPEYRWTGHVPNDFDRQIAGMYCYHNLVFFEKGRNEGASVADRLKLYE